MPDILKNPLTKTDPGKSERKNNEDPEIWMYPFLKKKLASADLPESAAQAIKKISRSEKTDVIRNLYADVLLEALSQKPLDNADGKASASSRKKNANEFWEKKLNIWPKTSLFRETLPVFRKNLEGQFQMASLMAAMSAFLFFLYLWAVIDERYLINFSVDSIVGIAALFFLIHNLRMQLRLAGSAEPVRRYALLDISGFILSFLFRMWMPSGFDVSLAVFIIIFFIEKKWFSDALEKNFSSLNAAGRSL